MTLKLQDFPFLPGDPEAMKVIDGKQHAYWPACDDGREVPVYIPVGPLIGAGGVKTCERLRSRLLAHRDAIEDFTRAKYMPTARAVVLDTTDVFRITVIGPLVRTREMLAREAGAIGQSLRRQVRVWRKGRKT